MTPPNAQDIIEKAVQALNRHKCISSENVSRHLSPYRLPEFSDDEELRIRQTIDGVFDRDWKTVLAELVYVSKVLNMRKKSGDTRGSAAPGIEDTAFTRLVSIVKTLTRIAASQKLWATKILSANCSELSQVACASRTKDKMEDAAGAIRQAFRITVNDYENEESLRGRTLKCYDVAVSLLRIYICMHAYPLAEGILNAVKQYANNIPPLTDSAWKTQVQFLFYKGTFNFYDQKYAEATECFDAALDAAHTLTPTQFERIMVFNIPSSFLSLNRVPTAETWQRLPKLYKLYGPLISACRTGNYRLYSDEMRENGNVLRSNRLYLACDTMLVRLKLNLLRRAWEILGRPKRLPLNAYSQALQAARLVPHKISQVYAAEFYIAQFILKGEVKGYIHHEMRLLMLSKSRPFPTLLTFGTADTLIQ